MFSSLKMPHLRIRSKRNSTGTIGGSPRQLTALHSDRATLRKPCEPSDGVLKKIIQVTLEKEDGSFGFALRGGIHADPKFSRPLVVTYVRPGGPADREGTMRPGDCLVAVNSTQVRGATLEEAQALLNDQPTGKVVVFAVEYNVNVLRSVAYASGPLYVEVERPADRELGVKLKVEGGDAADIVVIESVRPGSTADRCGALHVGDQLLAVGDTSLEDSRLSAAELTSLLHASNVITLHILPYACQLPGFPQYSSPSHSSSGLSVFSAPQESPHNLSYHRLPEEEPTCTSTVILTVELQRDGGPLGLTITGSEEPFEPIIISGLKQGGIADKCSSLQLGDQLLAVNGIPVQGKPLSEAILLLQNFADKITLKLCRTLTSSMMQGGDVRHLQPSPSVSPLSQLLRDPLRTLECSTANHCQQVELHQMILYKDPVYEDFGFSVSDGLYERGVFINRIRKGGPADLTNNLKPFDRILQVNDSQTLDYDCCMTVPLIAAAGDVLKLTITRRVSVPTDETENEEQEKSKYLPWLQEEADEKKLYSEDDNFLHIYTSDVITQPL